MLVPRVKNYREENGFLEFKGNITVYFADKTAKTLLKATELLIPCPITVTKKENADIVLSTLPDLSTHSAFFTLDSTSDKIYATFTDREGGRDALSVIGELLKTDGQDAKIKKVYIEDWPDLKFRSFMQDVGRKYVPMNEMKSQILLMAKMRMNVLHFHFTEYVGFAVALKDFPELKGPAVTGGLQYSEEDIRELIDFADCLAIDIIPEVDLPAHANAITSVYPELLCKTTDGIPPNGWALCIGNEETYVFLEKLLTSVTRLFKSEYFHLGTDEISMPDVDRIPKPVADFGRCSVCSSFSLSDTDLFYYFLRRAYEILKRLGKKMIIWNDQIDISHSPDLPHDILIEFWRVAAPDRGPVAGCSMQQFLEEGFDVINANFPDTYIDLYVDYDRLKNWNPKATPANDSITLGKIIGADFCAWDTFKHFVHSIPISTAFFSDRFRNSSAPDGGKKIINATSERLFGINNFNIFDYTKKVIDLDESLEIFKEDTDLLAVEKMLLSHTPRDISEGYLKNTYLSLIKK